MNGSEKHFRKLGKQAGGRLAERLEGGEFAAGSINEHWWDEWSVGVIKDLDAFRKPQAPSRPVELDESNEAVARQLLMCRKRGDAASFEARAARERFTDWLVLVMGVEGRARGNVESVMIAIAHLEGRDHPRAREMASVGRVFLRNEYGVHHIPESRLERESVAAMASIREDVIPLWLRRGELTG